ncbi:MAG: serine/threonine protein kinase [Planctomycetaceae bacterium]|nr:serine/threonine protein kinase [Planctomycetaceae bacterium]
MPTDETKNQKNQTGASDSSGKQKEPKKKNKVQQLGDFRLVKKIGQGGMGSVYLAHQISLDRKCALKVMSPKIASNKDFVARFIREARAMAKIEHPNVVRCYAVGEEKGINYVAMELIEGSSMQDWIDTKKTFEIGDAVHIIIVCAQALAHAHKMNIIHRDIKPDNILVTNHGAVKIADLGLAKVTDEDQSMTQSGTGLGTPLYMPPEQARNAKYVDLRSDIYALGCTLYKFLTGTTPFKADSTLELILNKEKGKFTPAAKLNKKIPAKLDLMIDKMIAKDKQHRYQSCDELLKDLLPLGLENQTLSFIDSDEKVSLGAASPSVVHSSNSQTQFSGNTVDIPKSSRQQGKEQQAEKAKESKGTWYVRFKDRTNKEQVKRMALDQIHRALATKFLDELTQVTKNPNSKWVSIGNVPVFRQQVNELIMERESGKRTKDLKSIYDQIDKQHSRQKWWRLLENYKNGTVGLIGLIVWLAIIGLVGYGIYLGIPTVWKMIAENFGLA